MLNLVKSFLTKTNIARLLPTFRSMKMAIIVRTDLKMGRGKIASQAAHAAVLLYQSSQERNDPHLKSWIAQGQPKIILRVDSDCEKTLREIHQSAKENNLNVQLVRDAGRTQVSCGTVTAVGIGPNDKEMIDKLTSTFKLL